MSSDRFRLGAVPVKDGTLRIVIVAPWIEIVPGAIPSSVFPLGLGRESVGDVVPFRTPGRECRYIVDIHKPDWHLLLGRDRLIVYPVGRNRLVTGALYELVIFCV